MTTTSTPTAAVPREFSIHLDLLRFGAAFMVMLFHIKLEKLGPENILRFIPSHGHTFVILFFVLSGYVIAATADRKKDSGLREFLLDRMARVYSVAVPVLVVCSLFALFLSTTFDPQRLWTSGTDQIYTTLGLNLLFLGQSWHLQMTPFTNNPYWSLCYEVMYYALFAGFVFLRGIPRILTVSLAALLAGPKVLLLLPCWLLGVAAYHWRDRWRLGRTTAVLVAFILPVLILIALNQIGFSPAVRAFTKAWFGAAYEGLYFSNDFLIDYAAASLVAIHLYAARYIGLRWPDRISTAIKAGAAMSFTLYLFQGPLVMVVSTALGPRHGEWTAFVVAAVGIPIVCYGIAGITESRRGAVRRWLDQWLPGGRQRALV